jgi:hypothetical protein
MQRPTGISALAILYGVSGGISFLMSCCAMAVASRLALKAERAGSDSLVLAPDFALWGNVVFWAGLAGSGVSVLRILAAIGLWTLNPLGWRLALVRNSLKLATCPVVMIRDGFTASRVAGVLLDGAILFYLSRPHVRHAFSGVQLDASGTAP